jgi:hypothetical protein
MFFNGGARVREEPLKLPPGYHLNESDPDVVTLLRPDGSKTAFFVAESADPEEIEREAWKGYRRETG